VLELLLGCAAPDEVTRNSLFYCNVATSAFSPVVADDLEIYERAQRTCRRAVRADLLRTRVWRHRPCTCGDERGYIRNQYRVWARHMGGDQAPAAEAV
jgi:hypothetical protein